MYILKYEQRVFFPNAAPFFPDVPDVRLRILCLPLGEGAAIGRPRLPLLTKGGAPRSELEY